MTCTRCGQPLAPEARFCGACGQAVAALGPAFADNAIGASLREVVLFDKLTTSEILRSPVFRFVFFLAMGPLALAHLDRTDFILWGIALYSALLWAMFVYRLFAGRDLGFRWAIGMVFVTCFVMVPLLKVYLSVPPDVTGWLVTRRFIGFQLAGYVLGVGVREELTKALPLLVLAAFTHRMKNPLSGLVLGFMSGIGFAVAENVLYVYKTVSHAVSITQETGHLANLVVPVYNNVIRMAMGPFVHGCLSGIFGYFIALGSVDPRRRFFLLVAGLGVSASLHGLYDTVVGYSPLVALLVQALAYMLLMTYILKARGLASAHDLGGGVFNRTVMGRVAPEFLAAAARAAAAAAPPSPTSWRLRGEAGTVAGRIVALEAEVKVGRDSTQCGVHVDEPTVSREHALLLPEADGAAWRVRRLSRTAPVLVNDEAHDDVRLRIGDRLQVGTAVFVVESA
ncbi:MAG TPA: PrsW family glutamic-type intramembrane protease [Vicinamibacteria bacterium]